MRLCARLLLGLLALAPGCGNDPGGGGARDLAIGDGPLALRPYSANLHVPDGYDPTKPTPLLILLHGYGASGLLQEAYFGLTRVSDEKTFLYVYPDGTREAQGGMNRFWNATDACCDFYGAHPDDVAYVNAIIDDMSANYNVDPKRIFVAGHSNGGFMANRLACDAPRLAAIGELAGATWLDQTRCHPAGPIPVLHVHGTADVEVLYDGDTSTNPMQPAGYPGAVETVTDWAKRNGCTGTLAATGATMDLDSKLAGAETAVSAFGGCPTGGAVELWTIQGAGHLPTFIQPAWPEQLWAWLSAHPKP